MKKPLKILIVVVIAVLVAVLGLFFSVAIPRMTAPVMDENETKAYILEQIQPQIDKIKEEHDIPDLQVELEFTKFEFTKPALFSNGNFLCEAIIEIEYQDYFVSDTFAELDDYTEEDMKLYSYRYVRIPEIEYTRTNLSSVKYLIKMKRAYNYDEDSLYATEQLYRTPDGNIYEFGEYSVYKNGEHFCLIKKLPGTSSNTNGSVNGNKGDKCAICNGTGYVKYYYGESDLQAYLDGHDPYTVGKCTSCGGTGKDK